MKKKLILCLGIIMFFFKNSASANYEKIFYDLNIESQYQEKSLTSEILKIK